MECAANDWVLHTGQAGGATASGPALGNGYEIILQGFNWESYREDWYKVTTSRGTSRSYECLCTGKKRGVGSA